jgi:4'-phosphopantetheinyl transferase
VGTTDGNSVMVRAVAEKSSGSSVNGRVSVCWAPLDVSAALLTHLEACLSPQERRRADELQRLKLRKRFLAAHGWLRHVLAGQLDCAPREVRIVAGERGKPEVADSQLCFSFARSAGIGLYATSWDGPVGVDLEEIRATADVDGIARRFFSETEQATLAAVPEAARRRACFECWTRKEALVKATGAGVTTALDRIEVGVGRRAAVARGWSIHDVEVVPGFAAALAAPTVGASAPPVQRVIGVPR